ncbi:MAG TPA: hypothetical protein VMU19_13690 [Bryobacteraceae bacterium]|nr:hypothetical protein [Bryobacteraceae bacterium]
MPGGPLYCDVSVPAPLDQPFPYSLPETLRHRVRPGRRILASFGSRKMPGVVLAVHDDAPVVLCDGDVRPSAWKETLDFVTCLPQAPCLIVTSRTAGEALWAEALNLGAHDVLSKPFERAELIRVLRSACLHWQFKASRVAERAPLTRTA